MRANPKQLNEVTDLVEEGKIKASIDKAFPLEETINAVLYVDKGRTNGKVVINIRKED